jgi:hypothetical protein
MITDLLLFVPPEVVLAVQNQALGIQAVQLYRVWQRWPGRDGLFH